MFDDIIRSSILVHHVDLHLPLMSCLHSYLVPREIHELVELLWVWVGFHVVDEVVVCLCEESH